MKKVLILFLGAMLLLGACDINMKPRLPGWDVDLTLPLLNERFLVSELVDSVNVVVGTNDILTITTTGEASTPEFGMVTFNPNSSEDNLNLQSGVNPEIALSLADPTGAVAISYGHVASGRLEFFIDLIDPAQTTVLVTLPDVTMPDGTPMIISSNDNPNWRSVDLSGYRLGVQNSGTVVEYLRINMQVQSNQPHMTPVGTCGYRLNSNISSDYFEGYLYNYERAVDGTYATIDIDYPEDFDQAVGLQEAIIYLHLNNEFGFSATFHGQVHSVNEKTGEERWVNVLDDNGQPFEVEAATQEGPSITELSFTNGISEVMQIMPNRVELVNGYLLINGGSGGVPGFVSSTNRLHCTYQVDMPCHFIVHEHVFTMQRPSEVTVSAETQNQIQNRLLNAALTLEVVNRIPLGATATLYVGNTEQIDPTDPGSYCFSKQLTLQPSGYVGPDVDANGAQIIQLTLNETELQVFGNPRVYVLASMSLQESLVPVTIYASPADYIQIRGMLTAKVKVSGDLP